MFPWTGGLWGCFGWSGAYGNYGNIVLKTFLYMCFAFLLFLFFFP